MAYFTQVITERKQHEKNPVKYGISQPVGSQRGWGTN